MPRCLRAPGLRRLRLDARVRLDARLSDGERDGVCGPLALGALGDETRGDIGDARPGGGETIRADVGDSTRGAARGDHAVGGGDDTRSRELGVGDTTRELGVGESMLPAVGDVTLNVGEPMRGSPNCGCGSPNAGCTGESTVGEREGDATSRGALLGADIGVVTRAEAGVDDGVEVRDTLSRAAGGWGSDGWPSGAGGRLYPFRCLMTPNTPSSSCMTCPRTSGSGDGSFELAVRRSIAAPRARASFAALMRSSRDRPDLARGGAGGIAASNTSSMPGGGRNS